MVESYYYVDDSILNFKAKSCVLNEYKENDLELIDLSNQNCKFQIQTT